MGEIVEDIVARERIEQLEKRMERDEQANIRMFEGSPQSYAQRKELDVLRDQVEAIRSDHVQRREIDELKKRQSDGLAHLGSQFDQNTGRRSTWNIAAAIIATLLGIAFGAVWKNQLTHGDVTQQIKTEAPWLNDRPAIEQEIQTLESKQATEAQKLAAIEQLDRFFCSTRTKASLPGC